MKVRIGFVSNSSSSSFIFKLKVSEQEPCQCCGRPFGASEDAIASLDAMKFDYDCTATVTLQEHIDNLRKGYPGDEEYTVEHLKEKGITDYKGLYMVDISYHNEGRKFFLESSGNFEVLDNFC